jgi:hypothetical protein
MPARLPAEADPARDVVVNQKLHATNTRLAVHLPRLDGDSIEHGALLPWD